MLLDEDESYGASKSSCFFLFFSYLNNTPFLFSYAIVILQMLKKISYEFGRLLMFSDISAKDFGLLFPVRPPVTVKSKKLKVTL